MMQGYMTFGQPKTPFTLRSIALFEIAKGLLALAAACGILSLRHTDLHAVVEAFLWRHGINPESPYRKLFIEGVARATKLPVGQVVAFTTAYVIIRFAEGYGLWFEKHWAEWFAVISASLYLPVEIVHLVHKPSWLAAGVVLVNVAIIAYLGHLLVQQRAMRRLVQQG